MRTINYESDFKLIESFKDGSSILAAPFRFTYYTKVSRGVYVAEYNGSEYVNCIPTEDGRVIVPFDSPKLGMGQLMVKREFFLNDADFADGVCNLVSVESTGITLDKGATDDMGEVNIEVFPFYQQGEAGKSAYDLWIEEGNEGTVADFLASLKGTDGKSLTYEDLTEDEKTDLASKIEIPVSDFINGGAVDMESGTEDVDKVAAMLTNEQSVALAIIYGRNKLNLGQTRFNVNSGFLRTDKYFFSENPIGVNVGDLLIIQKILGITRLQIIPVQDAKPAEGSYYATDGVISGRDKARINKIDGIESHLTDTRNWLTSVNDTLERNLHRTRFPYGVNINDCITTGVCAYTPLILNNITANWTIFVDCSSDPDSGGYYHLKQTAICRDGSNIGKMWTRLGWYKGEGEDLNFLDWQEMGGDGGSTDLSNYYTKSEVNDKIPTKTSELTNDSNYATTDDIQQAIQESIINVIHSDL